MVVQRVALVENMVALREETLEVHGGHHSDINDRFYAYCTQSTRIYCIGSYSKINLLKPDFQ